MYKTKLQELCVKQMWPLPDYAVNRDGPDHNRRFRASVTVKGVNFDAPDDSKKSREAQNKAAQVAVDHFAVALPPISSPQTPEYAISYKAQLFIFTQKKRIERPKYYVVHEGLDHTPRFKAKVKVDGQTFNSLQLFTRRRTAENDAAKVAMSSLSLDARSINSMEELKRYKNFLQELAQKEGILLPKYNTVQNGALYMPTFSSTVEFRGETFTGAVAKRKKQAEMNAAKVAWCELLKRLFDEVVIGGNMLSTKIATCQVRLSTMDDTISQKGEIAVKNNLGTVTMATSPQGQIGADSIRETTVDEVRNNVRD